MKGHRHHGRDETTESMKSCSCKKHLQLDAAREGWQTTLRLIILQVGPKILYLLILTLIALLAPQTGIGSSLGHAVQFALEHFKP
ncbi:hypothetical protein PUN71_021620 [Arthrobacter sp. NQ7]|uniref:hypothetical protein n=1 Tax=Arthrobacter sp. NQ7 TaxID=3032303 RepID=UPI00240F0735|nr:hypothetical protein [Arthrobacter sp. NQ7]MDJ0459811.1 hypothetical protein [Arthrobacter sp. NQ7]